MHAPPRILVCAEDFDIAAEFARLAALGGGGIGCFLGVVRNGAQGGLAALELEHYPGMTEAAIAQIADTACARFDLLGVTVIHRHGRLRLGENIVLVLAAAAHRGEALRATGFLIDWLKTRAPFWKREIFTDGSSAWVAARAEDEDQAASWGNS